MNERIYINNTKTTPYTESVGSGFSDFVKNFNRRKRKLLVIQIKVADINFEILISGRGTEIWAYLTVIKDMFNSSL
ncbi:MAG: hypothetical protein JG777_2853 [Clostridia bacterium]|jgi:hypothetical protein|nr:hypothetical protein [Clostridia bacterium]